MLLKSTPVDQRAGTMFVLNSPVVLAMAVASIWSGNVASAFALSASALQLLIAALSRYWSIGGDLLVTVLINGPIVIVLFSLAIWAKPRPRPATKTDGSGIQKW